jgi:S-formylglutathione hydrolase FrmB
MGGYGAARLGFRYPKLFRHVSIMGAGPMQESLDSTPRASSKNAADLLNEVYGSDQAHFKRLSPRNYAEQNSAVLSQSSHLRLVIGDQDETFENNDRFHAQLVRLGIPHDWIILPGISHNPMHLLSALGDQHWDFYRKAFDVVAA